MRHADNPSTGRRRRGLLRYRYRCRRQRRAAGRGRTCPLLRARHLQRHLATTGVAHTELPGERRRRPERVHQQIRHRLSRRRAARACPQSNRPAHRHRVPLRLSRQRNRPREGGDMRRDRKLQRLTGRTDLRRDRQHPLRARPAGPQHPRHSRERQTIRKHRRTTIHTTQLPPGADDTLRRGQRELPAHRQTDGKGDGCLSVPIKARQSSSDATRIRLTS